MPLLDAEQTARMGRTGGGGNGSPPAGPATPSARGGGPGGAFSVQQQLHAVSGRARHAMIALPIVLATFALVLQARKPALTVGVIRYGVGSGVGF